MHPFMLISYNCSNLEPSGRWRCKCCNGKCHLSTNWLLAFSYVQYVPANAQPWVNVRQASQFRWSVKIRSFWRHLACFRNRMPQTRPDFMLMLGFYQCVSITSPKKISCKISPTWISSNYQTFLKFFERPVQNFKFFVFVKFTQIHL